VLHPRLLEKQEQVKPKTSRSNEIIKIMAKINEAEVKICTKDQQKKSLVL
jgi:hypothetical protein